MFGFGFRLPAQPARESKAQSRFRPALHIMECRFLQISIKIACHQLYLKHRFCLNLPRLEFKGGWFPSSYHRSPMDFEIHELATNDLQHHLGMIQPQLAWAEISIRNLSQSEKIFETTIFTSSTKVRQTV